jgi:hypothetical protein
VFDDVAHRLLNDPENVNVPVFRIRSSIRGMSVANSSLPPLPTLLTMTAMLENLKDAVVVLAIAPGVPREPPVNEPVKTAVIRAYPQNAISILVKGAYGVTYEAIAFRYAQ